MVSDRYRTAVDVTAGVTLLGLCIWGLQRNSPLSHVLFIFAAALLSFGGASATVRARIPQYKRVSMLLLGAVALLALLVGPQRDVILGLIVVSLASGVDVVIDRVRHGEWLPTDSE